MNNNYKSSGKTLLRFGVAGLSILFSISAVSAADFIVNPEYLDTNNDGQVDQIDLIFDTTVTACAYEAGDWTINTAGTINITSIDGINCTGADDVIHVDVTADANKTGGAVAPVISYDDVGTAGSLTDLGGVITAKANITLVDKAAPYPTYYTYQDLDYDGTIEKIRVNYSESITSASGDVGDYTISGPDAGGISISSVSTFGIGYTLALTGTPAYDTNLDISLAYTHDGDPAGGATIDTIRDTSPQANIAPDFAATVLIDSAVPHLSAAIGGYYDTDGDGIVDRVALEFTESISDINSNDSLDYNITIAGSTLGEGGVEMVEAFSTGVTPNDPYVWIDFTNGLADTTNASYEINIAAFSVSDGVVNMGAFNLQPLADVTSPIITSVTYSHNPTSPSLDNLITVTYSEDLDGAGVPTIDIDQVGTTDIAGVAMTPVSASTYTYNYDVIADNGTTYQNGTAYVGFPAVPFDLAGNTVSAITTASNTYSFVIQNDAANSTPTDITLSNNSINENIAGATPIGNFTTTDADGGDTHTYSFVTGTGDTDNAHFAISGGGIVSSGALDFETKNSYSVRVRTTDSGVGNFTFDKQFTISILDLNENPAITSNGGGATANINVAENTTAVTTVVAIDVDAGSTLTYSIAGLADSAQFSIVPATGVMAFVTAPDFENPTDAGGNNVYDVDIMVSDGLLTDTQTLSITVTDVAEGGSGGGSSSHKTKDRCSGGDYSPSRYDGRCSVEDTSNEDSTDTETQTGSIDTSTGTTTDTSEETGSTSTGGKYIPTDEVVKKIAAKLDAIIESKGKSGDEKVISLRNKFLEEIEKYLEAKKSGDKEVLKSIKKDLLEIYKDLLKTLKRELYSPLDARVAKVAVTLDKKITKREVNTDAKVWEYRNQLLELLDEFVSGKDTLSKEELSDIRGNIIEVYKKLLEELK